MRYVTLPPSPPPRASILRARMRKLSSTVAAAALLLAMSGADAPLSAQNADWHSPASELFVGQVQMKRCHMGAARQTPTGQNLGAEQSVKVKCPSNCLGGKWQGKQGNGDQDRT